MSEQDVYDMAAHFAVSDLVHAMEHLPKESIKQFLADVCMAVNNADPRFTTTTTEN